MNLLEPFTGSYHQLAIWYVGTLTVSLLIAVILKRVGFVDDEFENTSGVVMVVFGVILMPTMEELVFRRLPLLLYGSLEALGLGTIIWTLMHGRRGFAIIPSALFYYKLWAAGMGFEAIIIHTAHNAVFIGIYLLGRRRKRRRKTLSPKSINL